MKIKFVLNHKETSIEVEGSRRLIDLLREDFNLTGVKEGCGEGECGACTVILNGKAVHACLIMAGQIDGCELLTIEGLAADGELDIIQNSFIKNTAIQCGYCTPGMIMSAKALLLSNPNPSEEQIREAIAGNTCRCSGYSQIVSAIDEAATALQEKRGEKQ